MAYLGLCNKYGQDRVQSIAAASPVVLQLLFNQMGVDHSIDAHTAGGVIASALTGCLSTVFAGASHNIMNASKKLKRSLGVTEGSALVRKVQLSTYFAALTLSTVGGNILIDRAEEDYKQRVAQQDNKDKIEIVVSQPAIEITPVKN